MTILNRRLKLHSFHKRTMQTDRQSVPKSKPVPDDTIITTSSTEHKNDTDNIESVDSSLERIGDDFGLSITQTAEPNNVAQSISTTQAGVAPVNPPTTTGVVPRFSEVDQSITVEEHKPEAELGNDTTLNNATDTTTGWKANLKHIREHILKKANPDQISEIEKEKQRQANELSDEPREQIPYYKAPDLSVEALLTDTVVKVATAHLDEISTRLGANIQKSTELANEWKLHISALDSYIKTLSTLPFKKTLKYTACLLTIGAFLWKMGALRAIPDFLSSALSLISTPTLSTTHVTNSINIPKPNIESTLKVIMETPMTPFAIVTGVGVLTVGLGLLKATLWVLRKAPK